MRHPSLIPLSHDHHRGLALALRCRKQALGQIKPMGAAGLRERVDEVLAFYQNNLVAHFRAEEGVLFPRLRSIAPQCAALIDALVAEHEQFRHLIEGIKADSGLAKLVFELGDLLDRHIRKEERELFPVFEQQVETAQRESIGVALQKSLASDAAS